MMQNYYSVFDKCTKEFLTIFPAAHNGAAIRFFKSYIESIPKVIADDLELWYINVFNTETGTFSDIITPAKVDIIVGDLDVKE